MLEYKPNCLKPYLKSSHYKTYNMLEYKPYYLKPYLKSSHYKTYTMLEYKPYYLKPYLKSSHYKTYNMLEYKPYCLKPYLKSSHYKTWFHQQLFSFSTDRKYKEYTTSIHSHKISFKKHIWSIKCILRLIKLIIRVLSGCVCMVVESSFAIIYHIYSLWV
jgi:hypothetical protein